MGILDKIFDRDDDDREKKRKADFSGVQTGGTTAPGAASPGATPAGTGTPTAHVDRERRYTVVAGDSLSKIAQREYGDASKWPRIYEANKTSIKDPDLIHPGQTFIIPDA